jgi:DNA repair protein RadC
MPEANELFPEQEAKRTGRGAGGAWLKVPLPGGGTEGLRDRKLIGHLLMTAVLRRDGKPLARALIGRPGSLARLSADPPAPDEFACICETSAAAIGIVSPATRRFASQPAAGNWQALISCLTKGMAHLRAGRVRLLLRNSRNVLIHDVKAGRLPDKAVHNHVIAGREGYIPLKAKALF